MEWFKKMKAVLQDFYSPTMPPDIVGYLRGSGDPNTWFVMRANYDRHQELILGNMIPSQADWENAGVADRKETHTITLRKLEGLIVIYAGFADRPWGAIYPKSKKMLEEYEKQLRSWQANLPRNRR